MITIACPADNIPERTYAINVLFNVLMGLDFPLPSIFFSNEVRDYVIGVGDKRLVVEDHFFKYYPEPLSYLKKESLPCHMDYFHGKGLETPIVYGEDKYDETPDGIVIGLDIFASTFFLLTRWEESLYGRDEKGDCDESLLFTVANNIYQRPLVNEYEDLLRRIMEGWGIKGCDRRYKVVLTHDVDGILTPTWRAIERTFRYQLKHPVVDDSGPNLRWYQKITYKLAFPNESSQIEMYTRLCEKYKVPEWFYFKVCGPDERESTYYYDDPRLISLIDQLRQKKDPNIVLGFHPSQNTFDDASQWETESERIVSLLGDKPAVGRNHHLLHNLAMHRLWEKSFSPSGSPAEISNCVFHKIQGFRSGICVPYPLFDYYERRQMNLMEHPNQIMDIALRQGAESKSGENHMDETRRIIDEVKKHNGELLLTWHIYIRKKEIIFNCFRWCEQVVQYARQ